MCGIAGLIGTGNYKEQDVKKMINKIDYRGPDEQGTIDLDNIYLGHARLAVVDPENGTQPMSAPTTCRRRARRRRLSWRIRWPTASST